MTAWTRRQLLLGGAGLAIALSGCTVGTDGETPTQTRTSTPTSDAGATDMSDDLNLREANVVGVEMTRDGTAVTFDVTLHHDDDGEDGYANWWQVESLDGTQLGRRVLTHPHSRQPFTRSDTIEIPTETTCVVVRGHDQTHGYGGQAILVNLDTGVIRAITQGSSRQSVTVGDCP